MDEKEAFLYLKNKLKPYSHFKINQSYFSNMVIRFEAGLLKPKTIVKFLESVDVKKVDGRYVLGERILAVPDRYPQSTAELLK